MTIYVEELGNTLLTGATDAEGDPIVPYRLGTTLPGGGTGGTILSGSPVTVTLNNPTTTVTSITIDTNGAPTLNDTGNTYSFPPVGSGLFTIGTYQYTLHDGQTESAVYTKTVKVRGVASTNPNAFVSTGLIADWSANLNVTTSLGVVTGWLDTVSSRALTVVGSPTLGTPAGGTATQTVVIPANAGFNSSNLTGCPVGASP